MRILLIEDDTVLGAAVRDQIAADGQSVDWVTRLDAAGNAQRVKAQQVIVAKGASGDSSVAQLLRKHGFAVHEAGDCTGVGYIEGAIRNAQSVVDAINGGQSPAEAATSSDGTSSAQAAG